MKLLRSCKLNLLQWRINPKYLAIFFCTWPCTCGM